MYKKGTNKHDGSIMCHMFWGIKNCVLGNSFKFFVNTMTYELQYHCTRQNTMVLPSDTVPWYCHGKNTVLATQPANRVYCKSINDPDSGFIPPCVQK